MQMLYDSDNYVVVHTMLNSTEEDPEPKIPRHGFEIVDKQSNMEVFLDGAWADIFQRQIDTWKTNTPTREAVEEILQTYTALAQNPLVMH